MHKTCWYTTIHPLRVGALVGSALAASVPGSTRTPAPDLDAMIRFGFSLGAAFHIRDDILNLVGDDRYGKEICGDLVEGKRTLMLIHLDRAVTGAARSTLDRYFDAEPSDCSDTMVAELPTMMDDHGSVSFAAEYAEGVASQAGDAFEVAFEPVIESDGAQAVRSLIPYMLDRFR